jgi:hypothetical protein
MDCLSTPSCMVPLLNASQVPPAGPPQFAMKDVCRLTKVKPCNVTTLTLDPGLELLFGEPQLSSRQAWCSSPARRSRRRSVGETICSEPSSELNWEERRRLRLFAGIVVGFHLLGLNKDLEGQGHVRVCGGLELRRLGFRHTNPIVTTRRFAGTSSQDLTVLPVRSSSTRQALSVSKSIYIQPFTMIMTIQPHAVTSNITPVHAHFTFVSSVRPLRPDDPTTFPPNPSRHPCLL